MGLSSEYTHIGLYPDWCITETHALLMHQAIVLSLDPGCMPDGIRKLLTDGGGAGGGQGMGIMG